MLSGFPLVAALFTQDARAWIYCGNPDLGFRVDRPAHDYTYGSVYLSKVRVYNCGTGYTDYTVNETIDPTVGHTLGITGGDLCSAVAYWGSTMVIHGNGSSGAFTVEYSETTTTVDLDHATIPPVQLTPYEVTSGTMSGGSPWLGVLSDCD